MKKLGLLCVVLLPLMAQAATFEDLLKLANLNQGSSQELPVEGLLETELRERIGGGRLVGKARWLNNLEELGCARYEVQLAIAIDTKRTELATVRINWCRNGLPPASQAGSVGP